MRSRRSPGQSGRGSSRPDPTRLPGRHGPAVGSRRSHVRPTLAATRSRSPAPISSPRASKPSMAARVLRAVAYIANGRHPRTPEHRASGVRFSPVVALRGERREARVWDGSGFPPGAGLGSDRSPERLLRGRGPGLRARRPGAGERRPGHRRRRPAGRENRGLSALPGRRRRQAGDELRVPLGGQPGRGRRGRAHVGPLLRGAAQRRLRAQGTRRSSGPRTWPASRSPWAITPAATSQRSRRSSRSLDPRGHHAQVRRDAV